MAEPKISVLVARDRPSAGGGIFNYYTSISRHLTNKTDYVDVGRPYSFYGYKDHGNLRFTAWRLLRDWFALLFKILRFRPGLVLLNPCLDPPTFRSLRRDAMNILIARLTRRPVLVFWRGWENAYCGQLEFPGGSGSVLCRIFKMAAGHIVLSERFRQDLLRWGFEKPVHVETTVVGDDCLAASPRNGTTEKRRTDLLYLSRVEVAKGLFELLDAYQILKARNPAYTLTVGGDGPDLEALQEYVKKLELKDVVFTGFLKGQAKVDCYRRAGMFCFLSYTEGMPNAVLEALAMGLPVVSSGAGGLGDILRDGENGFTVPPLKDAPARGKFDPVEVANAIERLAEDAELYRRIADFNRQYGRNRFAAPVVAKRLEAICRSVVANEPSPSNNRTESVSPICAE